MNHRAPARTRFLFAQPSWGGGLARGLDLFGNFDVYHMSQADISADDIAIQSDWLAIGDDLAEAIDAVGTK